jgi:uncharacterized protein (DUF1800 family)
MHKTLAFAAAACCAVILPAQQSYAQFEKKLSGDQEILHALDRLTFGPRPGDIEAVKKMGLSKWIDLQLHPERIPENEALAKLVEPLVEPSSPQVATLALANLRVQLVGLQGQQAARVQQTRIEQMLTPQQTELLRTGTDKEVLDLLVALPRDKAVEALAVLPALRQMDGAATTPGATAAAQPRQQVPLQQLLTRRQIQVLRTGPDQEALALLATLPPEKAVQVLDSVPAVRQRLLPRLDPELRRKLQAATRAELVPMITTTVGQVVRQQVSINQLLTPQQIQALRTGSDKEGLEVLATLPREKVVQVLAAMPAVRPRLLPLLDADLRKMVEAAAPTPAQPGQTLAQGKLYRAIQSDRQLEEVLVDFWYNHFNVDAGKGADRFMITGYERDSIRPHVLGKFRDLLEATANSPAMMFYLDNYQSTVAQPAPPNGPRFAVKQAARGLNENYARELMELHTLGVDGGYTQKDIVEVARCFTGWSIDQPNQAGSFRYNDQMHDKGEKTVLGVTIPAGGGKEDGEKVLDILARHPSTAVFISRELAQRFVADDLPPALIDRMAKTFRDSDGDIRAVLTTLFASREFFSEGAYRAKVKTPFEMIVSAVRATGAQVDNAAPLVSQIAALGEPLYRKLEPTGYSNLGEDWMSSAGLMGRMNFAMDLAQNQVEGVKVDAGKFSTAPAATARQILFTDAARQTLEAIDKAVGADGADAALVAGMLLGSPDFQRR